MGINILNIKCVSVSWWLYVLSNTLATFEAQFMKKSNNTESELKKSVAYKKMRVLYSMGWRIHELSKHWISLPLFGPSKKHRAFCVTIKLIL